MNSKITTGFVIILFFISIARIAGATILDFEGPPTGMLSGNEYATLGVLFSSEGGGGAQEFYSAAYTEIITSDDWYHPLYIKFVNPDNENENWIVTSVSMFNHYAQDYWIVKAYDLMGNLLDTQIVNYEAKTISFSGIGNIHSIVLDASSTAFGMDNLNFEGLAPAVAVPNYSCVEFESPLGDVPLRVKKNRVIPVKAHLFDDGYIITDLDITAFPVIQILYSSGIEEEEDVSGEAYPAGMGSEGNVFEYNPDTQNWQFNLKTKNYSAPGTYTINIISGDEQEYSLDTCTASFVIY